MSQFNAPQFTDPEKARQHLEALRWPDGPVCPHCGVTEGIWRLQGKGGAKGTKARPGLLKCGSCKKQFSVTVGTVFERSKIALNIWLQAVHLMCASKKGISSHQLHRMMGVTYKTAWFMTHRIREAMRELNPPKLGGNGGVFELDETWIGGKPRRPHGLPKGRHNKPEGEKKRAKRWGGYGEKKEKVFSLVERETGRVRSFHVADVTADALRPIIFGNIDRKAMLHTDESGVYAPRITGRYRGHKTVNHSLGEYVRGSVTTNRIEGYFSILKRGIYGTYQHVSSHHLKRYIGEFDFRYTNRELTDTERRDAALRGIEGKRLTYRQPAQAQ